MDIILTYNGTNDELVMKLEFPKVTQFQCRLTDFICDLNSFITKETALYEFKGRS